MEGAIAMEGASYIEGGRRTKLSMEGGPAMCELANSNGR